jgi:hypothetical protein
MANAKFLDFLDMIDGGGAGKMGDKFEGGGIFSALANIVAKPYGSEDEARKRARMQALGLLDTGMDMSKPPAAPTVTPVLRPNKIDTPPLRGPAGSTSSINVPPLSGPAGMPIPNNIQAAPLSGPAGMPTPPASDFMDTVRSAGSLSGPAGMPTPPKEPSLIAAEQLASELGNAWYMMPQQEQIMRINQRVQQMQGM